MRIKTNKFQETYLTTTPRVYNFSKANKSCADHLTTYFIGTNSSNSISKSNSEDNVLDFRRPDSR